MHENVIRKSVTLYANWKLKWKNRERRPKDTVQW